MKRNYLSVYQPKATSIFHAVTFNNDTFKIFHDNLKRLQKNTSYDKIYDADKTGVLTVYDPIKVVNL